MSAECIRVAKHLLESLSRRDFVKAILADRNEGNIFLANWVQLLANLDYTYDWQSPKSVRGIQGRLGTITKGLIYKTDFVQALLQEDRGIKVVSLTSSGVVAEKVKATCESAKELEQNEQVVSLGLLVLSKCVYREDMQTIIDVFDQLEIILPEGCRQKYEMSKSLGRLQPFTQKLAKQLSPSLKSAEENLRNLKIIN